MGTECLTAYWTRRCPPPALQPKIFSSDDAGVHGTSQKGHNVPSMRHKEPGIADSSIYVALMMKVKAWATGTGIKVQKLEQYRRCKLKQTHQRHPTPQTCCQGLQQCMQGLQCMPWSSECVSDALRIHHPKEARNALQLFSGSAPAHKTAPS